ncbi:hypothetical protein [Streptomyces sp. NPDC010273]|uniref:hypothetical protein n=1 Tax=Streptomyces sp. NPDC010273 TaxID=3364829 RepID=UPI0036E89320
MVRRAEVEREKRAKFINAEGQSLPLPPTDDDPPPDFQLRNPQSLVEISVDKYTSVDSPTATS